MAESQNPLDRLAAQHEAKLDVEYVDEWRSAVDKIKKGLEVHFGFPAEPETETLSETASMINPLSPLKLVRLSYLVEGFGNHGTIPCMCECELSKLSKHPHRASGAWHDDQLVYRAEAQLCVGEKKVLAGERFSSSVFDDPDKAAKLAYDLRRELIKYTLGDQVNLSDTVKLPDLARPGDNQPSQELP
jgi:hypothetical protein